MHAGVWDKSAKGAHEVRGRTLGIVGYGNIGSQLSVVAESLGMRVCFYDVADKLALGNARRCDTLDELLAEAETVSLHVDGRPGNAGLFGAEQFAKMRPRSLFLNLCRGIVVDHEALREHLLSAATSPAPRSTCSPRSRRRPGTRSSPACSGCRTSSSPRTSAARPRRRRTTSAGSWPASCATSRPAGTPRCRSTCRRCRPTPATGTRILHVHHNVPGVLATVNGVLGRLRRQHRGPGALHPRRAGLRDHRRGWLLVGHRDRSAARAARDRPATRPRLSVLG